MLAATLHAFPAGEDEAAALAAEGRNPYVIHSVPGHPPLGGLGYRRGAWMAGIGLGAVMVAASLVAGLLGPVAIALYAVVLSVPVWIAWYWLVRRG